MNYRKSTFIRYYRNSFVIINKIMAEKNFHPEIVPVMQKGGFDSNDTVKALNEKNYESFDHEIRKFIEYLRDKSDKLDRVQHEIEIYFTFIIILLVLVLFLAFYIFEKNINFFIRDSGNLLKEIASTVFNDNKGKFKATYIENKKFLDEHNFNIDLFSMINKISKMNLTLSMEEYIDIVGNLIAEYYHILPCDRFSVALFDKRLEEVVAYHAYTRYPMNVYLKAGFKQNIHDTSLFSIYEKDKEYRIINDMAAHDSITAGLLAKEGIKANLTIPIVVNGNLYGFIFFASKLKDVFDEKHVRIGLMFSRFLNFRFFYTYAIQQNIYVLSENIINIVEFKDDETADHTRRVSLYSELLAYEILETNSITPKKAREIKVFAPLHDIGKVAIPDSILLKPGKLTEEELLIMKTHVKQGARIIKNTDENLIVDLGYSLLGTAYNLIRDHHEKWDGSGYPEGKKYEEISIEGRIIAIADVFDALTTKRPYKQIIPFEQSFEIIKNGAGKHFDPYLVEVFAKNKKRIHSIYVNNYSIE